MSNENQASSRDCCAVDATGGSSLGRFLPNILRRVCRVPLVQHSVSVKGYGTVAIFLMLVVAFYWFAFMATIWWWFNAVMALWAGHYIRAAIWACLGFGMLAWWQGEDVIPDPWDFDKWLRASAWVVGLGVLATFVRWRKKQAMSAVPAWTTPPEATGNIAPIIEVKYRRLSD